MSVLCSDYSDFGNITEIKSRKIKDNHWISFRSTTSIVPRIWDKSVSSKIGSSASRSSTAKVGLKCTKICKTYLRGWWSSADTRNVVVVVVAVGPAYYYILARVLIVVGSVAEYILIVVAVARLDVASLGLLLFCSPPPSGLNSPTTGLGAWSPGGPERGRCSRRGRGRRWRWWRKGGGRWRAGSSVTLRCLLTRTSSPRRKFINK